MPRGHGTDTGLEAGRCGLWLSRGGGSTGLEVSMAGGCSWPGHVCPPQSQPVPRPWESQEVPWAPEGCLEPWREGCGRVPRSGWVGSCDGVRARLYPPTSWKLFLDIVSG